MHGLIIAVRTDDVDPRVWRTDVPAGFADRAVTIVVLAPLLVSVVLRTYGWDLILGNGPIGILNWVLTHGGHGVSGYELTCAMVRHTHGSRRQKCRRDLPPPVWS